MYADLREHTDHKWAFIDKFQSLFATAIQWLKAKQAYRKGFRQSVFELSNCSDRDLKDLGISRCEIRSIAHEAALKAAAR